MADELQKIVHLIKGGEKAKAKTLMREFLQNNPDNADGWYVASQLMDTFDQKNKALNRALAINPNHEAAKLQRTFGSPLDVLKANPFPPPSDAKPLEPQKKPLNTRELTLTALAAIGGLIIGFWQLARMTYAQGQVIGSPRNPYEELLLQEAKTDQIFMLVGFA